MLLLMLLCCAVLDLNNKIPILVLAKLGMAKLGLVEVGLRLWPKLVWPNLVWQNLVPNLVWPKLVLATDGLAKVRGRVMLHIEGLLKVEKCLGVWGFKGFRESGSGRKENLDETVFG